MIIQLAVSNIVLSLLAFVPTLLLLTRTIQRLQRTLIAQEFLIAYSFVGLAAFLFIMNLTNLLIYSYMLGYGLSTELISFSGFRSIVLEILILIGSCTFLYIDNR